MKCANQGPTDLLDRLARLRILVHKGEFVAAQACHESQAIRHFLEPVGDAHEHAVAKYMSQTVVEVLEVIDIEKIHTHMTAIALRAIDGAREQRGQMSSIRQ